MEELQKILDSVSDVAIKEKIKMAWHLGIAHGANVAMDEVIAQIEKIN